MQSSVKQADKKAENTVTFNELSKKAIEGLSRRMGVQEGKKRISEAVGVNLAHELLSSATPDGLGLSLLSLAPRRLGAKSVTANPVSSFKRSILTLEEPMVYVERGLKVFRHSRSCLVIGANAGDWLLSFSPKDWEDAKVLGSHSDPWLGLAGRSLRNLSFMSMLDLVSAGQECDMVLGAGSIEQLTSLLALFRTTKPVLLVSQGHSARCLAGTKPFRLTHAAVGGVATWSGKV
jgi:hypothetical protein